MGDELDVARTQVENLQSEYKSLSDQMESQANQYETELGKLKAKMKKTEEQHKAELTRAVQALELQIEKDALNLQS